MIEFYEEIIKNNKIYVYLPFSNIIRELEIPNTYYINTNGLLYNCFGYNGHKEANLIYTYILIKDAFYGIKHISLDSDSYISLQDLLKKELNVYKKIISSKSLTRELVYNYIHINCYDLNDPLLFKLILGIVSSKIILLEKFIELEKESINKVSNIEKIIKQSNDDINDILVRYCGFHKIESKVNKTITTSSLNFENFSEYLDRDFVINVVPKILLDKEDDELYDSLLVERFLDKNPQYNDKIFIKKLLIND